MPRLKELTDDEFHTRYDCDRFTATVLTNRFRYVVVHMANHLRTHAFSPILREAGDMCAMVSGPPELGYAMASVSEGQALFSGSIPDAVRITLEEYGLENLRPGDVILVNDYYRVGGHLNDAACIRPVFHNGRLVGAVTIRAHFADIGGSVMGGFDATKRTVYEDGLRVPPTLLHTADGPVRSTIMLLCANTRLANLCIPDMTTEALALALGASLLLESIERYGLAAYLGAIRYACDASAEAMNDALAAIPDGVYEGACSLDCDALPDSPQYMIKVRITKVGSRTEFDFRGSSRATRSAVNCAWPDVKTGVGVALKLLLDRNTPVTSGTLRNIDFVLPPSAPFNAQPPQPCMFYFTVVVTIVRAVLSALNPVLGEGAVASGYVPVSAIAYGKRPHGTEGLITTSGGPAIIGPWGATKDGDADSAQQGITSNLLTSGVEVYEMISPVAVWALSDYMPDTGGPGTYRGGAANVHDVMWRIPAEHRMEGVFHARRTGGGDGVYGGRAGPTTTAWLFDGDISRHGSELPELPLTLQSDVYRRSTPIGGLIDPHTNETDAIHDDLVYVEHGPRLPRTAGATIRVLTCAGGGWGDPFARDPELVKRDVRDEYVTVEGATRDYGVVVVGDVRHPEHLEIDVAATEALRAADRKKREEVARA